jgi:hypothetical protein
VRYIKPSIPEKLLPPLTPPGNLVMIRVGVEGEKGELSKLPELRMIWLGLRKTNCWKGPIPASLWALSQPA